MADVTDATFATDVVERSKTVPVVVDLWAPWCGPCKSLTPILEKVVGETQGLVELAKVNVDENPEVSAAFQVQSIPAVYAMKDGQVIDGFMGAQGEPEVVEFVQRVLNASTATVVDDAAEGEEAVTDTDTATISEPGAPAGAEPEAVAPIGVSAEEADAIEAELVELLVTVKTDDDARAKYVALLDQLGADDPRTNTYRRKLATALF